VLKHLHAQVLVDLLLAGEVAFISVEGIIGVVVFKGVVLVGVSGDD